MRLTYSEFQALHDYHSHEFPVLVEDAEEISPIPVAKKIESTEDTNEKLYQLATAIDALSKRVTASNALLQSVSEKLKTNSK